MHDKGEMEFRGRLKALSCADILDFLRVLNRRGLLSFSGEGASIGLYLRDGRIVHASSTRSTDRLSDLLVRWGLISSEQYDQVMRRAAGGERLGKALVDGGGPSPRDLVQARLRQVAQIAVSLFEWEDGEFVFSEGESPQDEGVEVGLPIDTVLVEGIRSVRNLALFRRRMPFDDWIFEAIPGAEGRRGVVLDPHEAYVLRLVDGRRSLGEIGATSEFGEPETLRALFLLHILGCLKMKGQAAAEAGAAASDGLDGLVRRYNDMFGLVYQYLMKEVGPISDHLLGRALRDLEGSHPALFHRASLGGDGTVDPGLLRQNLGALARRPPRDALIEGLNELLYAELLIVRRTLGPQHEGRILRVFKDARLHEPPAGGPA
ncbi:MAG: DUF4388 domain-containing protein [Acidobacteria bacterium]|nr:DUF4388 domain-containing protein [Acidobacteriota bacterium]